MDSSSFVVIAAAVTAVLITAILRGAPVAWRFRHPRHGQGEFVVGTPPATRPPTKAPKA
jgi:hypothetical protein